MHGDAMRRLFGDRASNSAFAELATGGNATGAAGARGGTASEPLCSGYAPLHFISVPRNAQAIPTGGTGKENCPSGSTPAGLAGQRVDGAAAATPMQVSPSPHECRPPMDTLSPLLQMLNLSGRSGRQDVSMTPQPSPVGFIRHASSGGFSSLDEVPETPSANCAVVLTLSGSRGSRPGVLTTPQPSPVSTVRRGSSGGFSSLDKVPETPAATPAANRRAVLSLSGRRGMREVLTSTCTTPLPSPMSIVRRSSSGSFSSANEVPETPDATPGASCPAMRSLSGRQAGVSTTPMPSPMSIVRRGSSGVFSSANAVIPETPAATPPAAGRGVSAGDSFGSPDAVLSGGTDSRGPYCSWTRGGSAASSDELSVPCAQRCTSAPEPGDEEPAEDELGDSSGRVCAAAAWGTAHGAASGCASHNANGASSTSAEERNDWGGSEPDEWGDMCARLGQWTQMEERAHIGSAASSDELAGLRGQRSSSASEPDGEEATDDVVDSGGVDCAAVGRRAQSGVLDGANDAPGAASAQAAEEPDEWGDMCARLGQWTQMERDSQEEVGQGEGRWSAGDMVDTCQTTTSTEAAGAVDDPILPNSAADPAPAPFTAEQDAEAVVEFIRAAAAPNFSQQGHRSSEFCEQSPTSEVEAEAVASVQPSAQGGKAAETELLGYHACRHFKRQQDAFEYADRYNEDLITGRLDNAQQPSQPSCSAQRTAEKCHTAGRRGALQVFCQEAPTTSGHARHFVAGSVEAMWQYCCSLPPQARHLYEVIRDQQPCKVYCDLEYATKHNEGRDGDTMVARLVEILREQIRAAWGKEIDPARDVLELDSSTALKFSRHLVVDIPGAAVRNNLIVGDLLSRCLGDPMLLVRKDAESRDLVPFVDMAVYSRNRHFRVYLSSKSNKYARLLPTERYSGKHASTAKALFLTSLICHFGARRDLLGGFPMSGDRLQTAVRNPLASQGRVQQLRTANPNSHDTAPSSELEQRAHQISGFIEQAAAMRAGGLPARVCSIAACGEGQKLAFGLAGPGSHYCENIGRMHRSNHVFFLVDLGGGVYAQKCYDPDCRHFRSAWLPLPAAVASQLHISTRKPARSAGHPATCECTKCQLVAFDRNPKYGPKSGITRHQRARRALDLSLGLSDGLAQLILGQKDAAYDIK
eukprot:jgi/Tetstr1/457365/TSEL_043968.t1